MALVNLSGGTLGGASENGIDRYLGIPYAAAPVGDLRFEPPAEHHGWYGVQDATTLGATSPQAPYGGGLEKILPTVEIPGDEYLTANVWTPAGASGLPVMVWIHGGALSRGSIALESYDGSTFARDGVVYVALSYRVGSEGFSVLEGAELNLGFADVLAGLRWVQREIAAFGGDPRKVTVFGESAGGNLIAALLAHPDASALVSQAIIESGPLNGQPFARAGRVTNVIAKHLGIEPTREAFSSVSSEHLVAAQLAVTPGSTPISGAPGFALAIGPGLIPVDPIEALVAGASSGIPLIIGANSEEYRLWFVPSGLLDKIKPVVLRLAMLRFGIGPGVLKAYRRDHPDANAGTLLGMLATDLLLRLPLNRLADARLRQGARTWVYDFTWRSPVLGLGAAHAMELGFVFDRLRHPDSIALAGADAPQQLADDMHSAWVRFATTGDPGWEEWNAQRATQEFSAPASAIVYGARDHERTAWKQK